MKRAGKILALIIAFAIMSSLTVPAFAGWNFFNEEIENAGKTVSVQPTSNITKDLRQEIREKIEYDVDNVSNILLLGVDNDYLPSMDQLGNADGILLVSINENNKEVVMTSFLRDTRVRQPGWYNRKLTQIYHNGGTKLLIEAMETDFRIPIDNYILVNYIDLVEIVDALGGVDLELSEIEIKYMAGKISNINTLVGEDKGANAISTDQAGMLHLNGVQTSAYLRIRPSATDDDKGRTERARKVVIELLKKIQKMSIEEMIMFADTFFSNIETDMRDSDLMTIIGNSDEIFGYEMISDRVPRDGEYTPSNDGNAYVIPNFELTNKHLFESIYGGIH